MGNRIKVEPDKLKSAAQKMDELITNYRATYKSLFDEVDTMATSWKGQDNQAFTTQIKGFQNDFDNMAKAMQEYSEFLKISATNYEKTQQEIVDKARQLSSGN